MPREELGFDNRKFFRFFVNPVRQLADLFALLRRLESLRGTAANGVCRSLFLVAVSLGVGPFGIQLKQAGGKNVGLFFGVDNGELFFKLHQSGGRAFHFRLEIFELPVHEDGLSAGGLKADCVGMVDVAFGDSVRDFGGKRAVGRAVGDLQQVGLGWSGDSEIGQNYGNFIGQRIPRGIRLRGADFQLELLDDGAEYGIGFDQADLGGEEKVGVVHGRGAALIGLLTDHRIGRHTIHIDGDGGFVIGRQTRGNDDGGRNRDAYEEQEPPFVTAEHPEVMGDRDRRAFRIRFGALCLVVGNTIDGYRRTWRELGRGKSEVLLIVRHSFEEGR